MEFDILLEFSPGFPGFLQVLQVFSRFRVQTWDLDGLYIVCVMCVFSYWLHTKDKNLLVAKWGHLGVRTLWLILLTSKACRGFRLGLKVGLRLGLGSVQGLSWDGR